MRRAVQPLLLIVCAGWLGVLLSSATYFPPTDSWAQNVSAGLEAPWRVLVDFRFNSLISWRTDPWVETITRLLGASSSSIVRYQFGLLLIFWAGWIVFLRAASYQSTVTCAAVATIVSFWIALIAGASTIVWGTLAWVPWLALAILFAQRTGEFFTAVLILLFTVRIITTASHVAPLAFVLSLAMALCAERPAVAGSRQRILWWWTGIVLIGGYVLCLSQMQQAPFPDYPPEARVIHEQLSSGFIRPLIGFDYQIPMTNRLALQVRLLWPFVALFVFGLAAVWISRANPAARRSAILVSSLAVIGVWDSIPHLEVWQVGPLAALSRMLPDLSLSPLSSILFASAALPLSVVVAVRFADITIPALVGITAVAAATISGSVSQRFSFAQAAGEMEPMAVEQSLPQWAHGNGVVPTREAADWQRALLSPSRYVAWFYGRSTLAVEYLFSAATPRPLSEVIRKSWASVGSESLDLLMDGDPATRYSTARAYQDGTETIVLWFRTPQTLVGIQLDVGSYFTDFPRGIEIRGADECDESPELAARDGAILAQFSDWQGPPRRTPDGLPYFGNRNDVRIPFKEPTTVTCLRIRQTGSDPTRDLSITEAHLLPLN